MNEKGDIYFGRIPKEMELCPLQPSDEKNKASRHHEFSKLRQKAKALMGKIESHEVTKAAFDSHQLLEELNVYHIELELQHEEILKTRDQLELSEKYLNTLFQYAPLGYVVMDLNGVIKDINEKALHYFQVNRHIFIGQRLQAFIPYEDLNKYNQCLTTLLNDNISQQCDVRFRIHGGFSFWARIDLFIIDNPNESGKMLLCSLMDISSEKEMKDELIYINSNLETLVNEKTQKLQAANTKLKVEIQERQKAEEEARTYAERQTTLMREVNHRVKNNMQIMVSLMNLQARRTTHPDAVEAIRESQNRIKALAMIHESLYQAEDLATIPLPTYLNKLSNNIATAYGRHGITIQAESSVNSLHIDQALPLGLVMTELITNAVKYAFPDQNQGRIDISVRFEEKEHILFIVKDDGIGIPETVALEKPETLGLHLVQRLVEDQLRGSVVFEQNKGTEVRATFLRQPLPQ